MQLSISIILLVLCTTSYGARYTFRGKQPKFRPLRRPARRGDVIVVSKEMEEFCERRSTICNFDNPFRTIDGTCNNPDEPFQGSTGSPLARLADPMYAENNEPDEEHKPNVRLVSTTFHPPKNVTSSRFNLILMLFGQFLDHDMSLSPEIEAECCGEEAQEHPEEGCFPIMIPEDDEFYTKVGLEDRCLEFTRSEAVCGSEEFTDNVREQVNTVTAYIDASNVYGSTKEIADSIREFKNGRLKTNPKFPNELLPEIDGKFRAGDSRAAEMPGLLAMHTLFMREHNRIAAEIKSKRRGRFLSDEEIYQMARRILIGEYQNIIYSEYLPIVIGQSQVDKFWNGPRSSSTYSSSANVEILNEFATAAYRFGHSLIQDMIPLSDVTNPKSIQRSILLRTAFFNTDSYVEEDGGGFEKIISGMIGNQIQKMDRFISKEVTNFLFLEGNVDSGAVPNKTFGGDLVARNLQRSREHGLPGYNVYRKVCGLKPAKDFTDFEAVREEIPLEHWNILKELYKSPDDIDLFTGGLAEIPFKDGLTGATFVCIKSMQFKNLLEGDRFFFTHRSQAGSFSARQKGRISSRTLSDIICDNTDITTVPTRAFEAQSPVRSCRRTRGLNVNAFLRNSRGLRG